MKLIYFDRQELVDPHYYSASQWEQNGYKIGINETPVLLWEHHQWKPVYHYYQVDIIHSPQAFRKRMMFDNLLVA